MPKSAGPTTSLFTVDSYFHECMPSCTHFFLPFPHFDPEEKESSTQTSSYCFNTACTVRSVTSQHTKPTVHAPEYITDAQNLFLHVSALFVCHHQGSLHYSCSAFEMLRRVQHSHTQSQPTWSLQKYFHYCFKILTFCGWFLIHVLMRTFNTCASVWLCCIQRTISKALL